MSKYIFVFVFAILVAGCSSHPVLNIEDVSVPSIRAGDSLSLEQVETAIITASQERGWSPKVISPGLIESSISLRTHYAVVEIRFSESAYSIHYKDSTNLDYRDGEIHRNYNNWVLNLSNSIRRELGAIALAS